MPASSNSSSVISENQKAIAKRYPPPLTQDRTGRNQLKDRHGLQATRLQDAVNLAVGPILRGPGPIAAARRTGKSGLTGRHCPIAITPVNDAGTVAGHRARPLAAGPVAQWLEPAAHNGLVAGSSPAGPTTIQSMWPSRRYIQAVGATREGKLKIALFLCSKSPYTRPS